MWGAIGAAAIGAGASLLGGKKANEASARSVERQIAFQKESAQNRYQWTTADMKKAGINPMVAYSQGAGGALSGASYKAENIGARVGDAVNTGLAARRQEAELENINQDTDKKREETYSTAVQGAKRRREVEWLEEQIKIARESVSTAKAAAAAARQDEEFYNSDFGKKMRLIDRIGKSINPFATSAKTARDTAR